MNSILILAGTIAVQSLPATAPAAPVAATVPAEPVAQALPAASVRSVRLPALTPVRLRVVGEVSSKTHVKGDAVAIVLADALRLSDTLTIPAGTRGRAEVIHSAEGGMGGKAGELLIAARSLHLSPTVQIPLRSFRLGPATGKNNQGLATGLSIAGGVAGGIAAMVITGGSARVPDGSEGFAKTASDVDLPVEQLESSGAAAIAQ